MLKIFLKENPKKYRKYNSASNLIRQTQFDMSDFNAKKFEEVN